MSERKIEKVLESDDKSRFKDPIIEPYDKNRFIVESIGVYDKDRYIDKNIDLKKVSDRLDKMLNRKKYIDTTKELIVFNMKLNNLKKSINTSDSKKRKKNQMRISREYYKNSIEKRYEKWAHNKAKKLYTNNKTKNLNKKLKKMGKSIKDTGIDIIRPRHRIRDINRTLSKLEPYTTKVKNLANNRYIKKISKFTGSAFTVFDIGNDVLKIATAEEKEKEILKTAGSKLGDIAGKVITAGVVAAFPALIPIAPAISFVASELSSKAGEKVGEFIYSKNKDRIKVFSKKVVKNTNKLKNTTKAYAKRMGNNIKKTVKTINKNFKRGIDSFKNKSKYHIKQIAENINKKRKNLKRFKKHIFNMSKKYIKKIKNRKPKLIQNIRRRRSLNNRNNSNNIRKKNIYIRTTPKIDISKLSHKISGIFAHNISLRLANS